MFLKFMLVFVLFEPNVSHHLHISYKLRAICYWHKTVFLVCFINEMMLLFCSHSFLYHCIAHKFYENQLIAIMGVFLA